MSWSTFHISKSYILSGSIFHLKTIRWYIILNTLFKQKDTVIILVITASFGLLTSALKAHKAGRISTIAFISPNRALKYQSHSWINYCRSACQIYRIYLLFPYLYYTTLFSKGQMLIMQYLLALFSLNNSGRFTQIVQSDNYVIERQPK